MRHKWRETEVVTLHLYHIKQMLTQFLINNLGLRFLLSDEHKKEGFCHYGYMQFLLVFLPLFSHLTFLSVFPFISFSLTPDFSSSCVISLHLFSLIPVPYTFHFSSRLFMWPFAFIARKKWCFKYAWNISYRKLDFSFQTGIRFSTEQNFWRYLVIKKEMFIFLLCSFPFILC